MGLAEQRGGRAGKPSSSGDRRTSGIPFEIHANFVRAATGKDVAVLLCVMARLTQQYRCRGEGNGASASNPELGWL